MTPASILGARVPLGRTVLLAWLTATLLHFRWAAKFSLSDISPVEFALQAGLFFGYYLFWLIIVRLISMILVALVLSIAFRQIYRVKISEDGNNSPPSRILRSARKKVNYALEMIILTLAFFFAAEEAGAPISKFIATLTPYIVRASDVVAMFAAFLFYSELLLNEVSLLGLILAFVFYIWGTYHSE